MMTYQLYVCIKYDSIHICILLRTPIILRCKYNVTNESQIVSSRDELPVWALYLL